MTEFSKVLSRVRLSLHQILSVDHWIVAFGAAAREENVRHGWSDVDLIVFPGEQEPRTNNHQLRSAIMSLSNEIGLEITAVIVDRDIFEGRFRRVSPFNSVLLNALSGRADCGKLVSGAFEFAEPELSHEKRNAQCYVENVRSQISRLYFEPSVIDPKDKLRRLIKWSASYARAFLRTHGVFTLPYAPSLAHLTAFATAESIKPIANLWELRSHWSDSCVSLDEDAFINACDAFFAIDTVLRLHEPHISSE